MSPSKKTRSRTLFALRILGPAPFLRLIWSMLFSVNHYYLLGKKLAAQEEFPAPSGVTAPLTKITAHDLVVLRQTLDALESADKREVLARLFFYEDGFENCYVMKRGEEIVYVQWVIFPWENGTLEERYRTKFYPLAEKQVMIENAFTFPRHRGQGHLLHGTTQLLRLAKDRGYSAAICYIRKDRIASLNEFARMGFHITRILTEYKVLGRAWRTL